MGFLVGSFAVSLFTFSTNATSKCKMHSWHDPCASPSCPSRGEVLSGLQGLQIFQCYVIAEMILLLFGERREDVMILNKLFPKAIPFQGKISFNSPKEKPGRGSVGQTHTSPLTGGCIPLLCPHDSPAEATARRNSTFGKRCPLLEKGMNHLPDPKAPHVPHSCILGARSTFTSPEGQTRTVTFPYGENMVYSLHQGTKHAAPGSLHWPASPMSAPLPHRSD